MYSPPWGPYCPQGGNFYACGNGTKFVGCCDGVNPCTLSIGCSAGNLRQTSFDPSKYGTFHDQQCSEGLFYTCEATTPDAFFGCCTINPCANNGCPQANLAAAYLSSNPAEAADMDPYPPVDGSSVSASSAIEDPTPTLPPITSRPSPAGSSYTDSTAIPDTESKSVPVGATIGISVGGFVLLCAILAIVLLVRRNARKSSVQHDLTRKSSLAPPNVPVYQEHSAPAPRYLANTSSTQSMEPQQNGQQSDAKTVSLYKPYLPFNNHSSQYSLQPQLASSSPCFSEPTQSVCWSNNGRGTNSRAPLESQYSNQEFARVHQGPPQELGCGFDDDLSHRSVTPGVQHIRDVDVDESKTPRTEADARSE